MTIKKIGEKQNKTSQPSAITVRVNYKDGTSGLKTVQVPSRKQIEKLIKQRKKALQENCDWVSMILAIRVAFEYKIPVPDWLKDIAVEAVIQKAPLRRGKSGNPYTYAETLWDDVETWILFYHEKLVSQKTRGAKLAIRLSEQKRIELPGLRRKIKRAEKYIETGIGDLIFREVIWPAIRTPTFQERLKRFGVEK